MSDKDGGYAFPCPHESAPELGMTLRDFFAAKALTLGGEFFHNLGNGCDTETTVAEAAYQIADAMLKARSK
jgi:hypothetical protein